MTALILALVILPIGFLYTLAGILFFQNRKAKRIENYLYLTALSIDQLGNVVAAYVFNDTLTKRGVRPFGHPDETISGVLGKNETRLTWVGRALAWFLNTIDKNHIQKAIENVNPLTKKF